MRIIQEALTNVRKHACAQHAHVMLARRASRLLVTIEDDGQGFDMDTMLKGQNKKNFGLTTMHERAEGIGGYLDVQTQIGGGTRIIVSVPCEPKLRLRPKRLSTKPRTSFRVSSVHLRNSDFSGAETVPLRVLLVDDHILFRKGLASLLSSQPEFAVIGEAGDGLEGLEKTKALKPDLVLMDVTMPRCTGPEATRLITREMPDMQIVMLSVSDDDQDLFAAIRAGAIGYLLKSIKPDELFARLRGIAAGEAPINRLMAAKILREFAHSPAQPEAASGELAARDHRARARSVAMRRQGHEQPRDRRGAQHRRKHGQEPCAQHPRQAAPGEPRADGGVCGADRVEWRHTP